MLAKLPGIDPLSLNEKTIQQLENLLAIDHALDKLKPSQNQSSNLLTWLLSNLRNNFHMLNSTLVHVKTMTKTNTFKDKSEHFILRETVSRSR